MDTKKLIYGQLNDTLVFVPEEHAQALAQKWRAILRSKTWQDFIDFTSQEVFDDLMFEILEVLGYEKLYTNYLQGEDLSTYVPDLYLPQPSDAFTTDILPDFEQGDYMPILEQEIIAWLPDDLMDNIGELKYDENHDFYYDINPEMQNMVVQTFEAAGYACTQNQILVQEASGIIADAS